MRIRWITLAIMLVVVGKAQADLYLEGGWQSGGESLALTNDGDSLKAGGGLKLAAGIQNPLAADGSTSLRLAVGYLSDSLDAFNGNVEIDSITFDALYIVEMGRHRLGFGPTLHLAPEYRDHVAGYPPATVEFDDALGFSVGYGYSLPGGLEIGVRLNQIEYQYTGGRIDAGSLGVYLSNGF
jgi:hypothetical protein